MGYAVMKTHLGFCASCATHWNRLKTQVKRSIHEISYPAYFSMFHELIQQQLVICSNSCSQFSLIQNISKEEPKFANLLTKCLQATKTV